MKRIINIYVHEIYLQNMKKNPSRLKPLILYTSLLLISFLIGWFSQVNKKSNTTIKSEERTLLNKLLSCPPGENASSYRCTIPLVSAYIKTNNIESLFSLLKKEYETNHKVGAYCHPLGHTIGRTLFQKYGYVESLNMCDPFCADGCTMGVMEEFLAVNLADHQSKDLVVEKADKACDDFAKGDNVKRSACIHGTGHGIMPLVLYQTQDALDLCEKLNKDKGSCYDAAFMEKFLPSDPKRKVSKTNNLYEYCSSYNSDDEQKKRCFGYLPYAWKEWGKKPEEILELCSAPRVQKDGCGRGLVRLYLPSFVATDDLTFFSLYQKASVELQEPMVKYGAIYIAEYSPSKASDFCKRLEKPDHNCTNQVKSNIQSMGTQVKE